jgi:hypothetical protein
LHLSLKEEKEIIQLKEMIFKKVNSMMTQPDVDKEKSWLSRNS